MKLIGFAVDAEGQSIEQLQLGSEHQTTGYRPHPYGQPNPHRVPPSPPIDPQLGFDVSHQSPSATSSHSSTPAPHYVGSANNNLETHQQRQPPQSSQPMQSPYHYPPSPSAALAYPCPSPAQTMYFQRPLPNDFPPPNTQDGSPIDPNDPNQWQHQHHHYMAPSSSTNFTGQSQDRYVCNVCNKAFSRPSSLRIHSHSHTGEKPFQCPHKGCGKAFSVRSNMKRHERGCHGGGSPGST